MKNSTDTTLKAFSFFRIAACWAALFFFSSQALWGQALNVTGGYATPMTNDWPSDILTIVTIEAWVNPTSNSGAIYSNTIVGNAIYSGTNIGFDLRFGDDGVVQFVFGSGGWHELTSVGAPLPTNTWTHVAVTFNWGVAALYINGVLNNSHNFSISPYMAGAPLPRFGASHWGGREMSGQLDDIRIWGAVRSQAEIAANMNKELCGTESGLDLYYPFNCSDNKPWDKTNNRNHGTFVGGAVKASPGKSLTAASGCSEALYCVPFGEVDLFNQSLVDAFPTTYGCYCNCPVQGSELLDINGTSITNLDNLSQLTTVEGDFFLRNTSLTSLSGLSNLASVGGYLYIKSNGTLTTLTGLSGLTSVGDYLYIENNDALTTLTGLSGLTSVGDNLRIVNNDALTSLSGLSNLASVGNGLSVSYNAALPSFVGLSGLTSVGGGLFIDDNTALTSFAGLSGLTSVAGGLDIRNNAALTSLSGLENIQHATITNLHVYSNPLLSTCEVESICDYLGISTNPASISGNATNCASRTAVETACAALLPVELSHFGAKPLKKSIELDWATQSETDNAGFEIERSMDGKKYEAIGFVDGKGHSSNVENYVFEDRDVRPGTRYYYRLRQMDFDGTSEYSTVTSARLAPEGTAFSIWPNPATGSGELNIKMAEATTGLLRLTTATGQEVLKKHLDEDGAQLSLRLPDLPAGLYFVEIQSGSARMVERLLVE